MSNEIENTEYDEQTETQPVEFVTLKNHDDYEILTVYPFTIRKKSNRYEVKEFRNNDGYIRVKLNGKQYLKHQLIAEQFIPNPDNLPQIDHVNHDRTDYHINNLRWISRSKNSYNKASYKGVQARYVDSIPEDSLVVDYYETKTEQHEFEGYYFHNGNFYYDNDCNYRVLNINENKTKCKYVRMMDKNNQSVSVVIARFLEQHDLSIL